MPVPDNLKDLADYFINSSFLGGLIGGGLLTAVVKDVLERKRRKTESIFDERKEVYAKLLGKLRIKPVGSVEHDTEIHGLINRALLLTSCIELKEILRKIGNDLNKQKYWRKSNVKISKRLRRMESLMQRDLGIKIKGIFNVLYRFSPRRFSDLERNDICVCGSGRKYKNCHGKNK